MFLLKKIIAPLFLPLSFCLIIMFLGWMCLFTKRWRGWGRLLVLAGMVSLMLFSYGPISNGLMKPLEDRYPPIGTAHMTAAVKDSLRWIVVLGGGCSADPRLAATAQLSGASAARLLEAIRLHGEFPHSRILLSGGAVFGSPPEARIMAQAAHILGVNARDIALEPDSRDTEEQAAFVHRIVGADRFILVTTASHMPRAIGLFRKAGMDPIPAPTQFFAEGRKGTHPGRFYPQAEELAKSGLAIYEYLGTFWSRMRGRI